MRKNLLFLTILAFVPPCSWGGPKSAAVVNPADNKPVKLWNDPSDIRSRDLFYGPGGEKDAPHGTFVFEKEDLDGTNPKFVARDQDGVKWKVKMGEEVRPETVASRFVWAAGYFADEDYYLPQLHVENLPAHLRRGGQKYVAAGGVVVDVRLKRYLKGEEKEGDWKWRDNPFSATRELNGLRVMMALINNWDLKDVNNAVYDRKGERIYLVSDLGASFGTTGRGRTRAGSKGNLGAYEASTFIRSKAHSETDFGTPSRMTLLYAIALPQFINRIHLEWIGRHIPDDDARWMGKLLAQLTPEQIRAAFRSAGYTPDEVEAFSRVIETRIAQLAAL